MLLFLQAKAPIYVKKTAWENCSTSLRLSSTWTTVVLFTNAVAATLLLLFLQAKAPIYVKKTVWENCSTSLRLSSTWTTVNYIQGQRESQRRAGLERRGRWGQHLACCMCLCLEAGVWGRSVRWEFSCVTMLRWHVPRLLVVRSLQLVHSSAYVACFLPASVVSVRPATVSRPHVTVTMRRCADMLLSADWPSHCVVQLAQRPAGPCTALPTVCRCARFNAIQGCLSVLAAQLCFCVGLALV
jgi:hypothetical protein